MVNIIILMVRWKWIGLWMFFIIYLVFGQVSRKVQMVDMLKVQYIIWCVFIWFDIQLLIMWNRLVGIEQYVVNMLVWFMFMLQVFIRQCGSYSVSVMKLLNMKKQYSENCQICRFFSGVICLVNGIGFMFLWWCCFSDGFFLLKRKNSIVVMVSVMVYILVIMVQLVVIIISGVSSLVIVELMLLVLKMFSVVFCLLVGNYLEMQVMFIEKLLLVMFMYSVVIRNWVQVCVQVSIQVVIVLYSIISIIILWLLN